MKLQTKLYRIIFIVVATVGLYMLINVLLESPVTNANVIVKNLHLKNLVSQRPARGSLNYDLYVQENNNHYKIGADYADCFYYGDFSSKVIYGDVITVGVKKDNGMLSYSDLLLVVSLKAKNEEFLGFECVNEQIANNKKYGPLFGVGFLIIFYLMLLFREASDIKKRKKRSNPAT